MRKWLLVAALLVSGCVAHGPKAPGPTGYGKPRPQPARVGGTYQTGKATWYSKNLHGGPTASGERYDQNAMTAAHKQLPFDTRVRVISIRDGRSVVVRINDRGPYGKGRVIDVSFAAAKLLDMIGAGVIPVRLEIVELGHGRYRKGKKPPRD